MKPTLTQSAVNEFGHIAQGIGGHVMGTDTIHFINDNHILPDQQGNVTYAHVICELFPQKKEVKHSWITVGGNLIDYPGQVIRLHWDYNKCMVKLSIPGYVEVAYTSFSTCGWPT